MSESSATAAAPISIGVDVGGTFTDAVLCQGGRLFQAKTPTTPDDHGHGVITAIDAVLAQAALPAAAVSQLTHGMTVGTNALLEGTGASVALITTEGFADVVALRRQDRAHLYRLSVHHPQPVVPEHLRFEVRERCGPDGVLIPLDAGSLEAAIDAIEAAGVEAVAVALLFAFRFPDHERVIAARLRQRLPHVHVSRSSDVVPEIREYERFSTTCVDAHLSPVVGRYLAGLGARCRRAGLPEPTIMQSSGGTIDLAAAAAHGAFTVLSGPAGGVIGAAAAARAAGYHDVLAFDMGGTSCDVALIEGDPARTAATVINGHPVHLPMLDIHTVSAGGGSIAWVDSGGALRVGPQSAGARPGPSCYLRGGQAATVTDANVVLGRIDTAVPLGQGLRLDPTAAQAAVQRVAEQLGTDVRTCAEGIVGVAVAEMARALRVVSVERGIDPRGFALVAFGGAGPLHACAVADALDMNTIVLPPAAGVLAAVGMVVAGERRDISQTVLARLDGRSDLAGQAMALHARLGDQATGADIEWSADCRYVGQAHEICVPWEPSASDETLARAFQEAHEGRCGGGDRGGLVEVVTLRCAARRPGPQVRLDATRPPPPPVAGHPFALDGATGWLPPGWSTQPVAGALVVTR